MLPLGCCCAEEGLGVVDVLRPALVGVELSVLLLLLDDADLPPLFGGILIPRQKFVHNSAENLIAEISFFFQNYYYY